MLIPRPDSVFDRAQEWSDLSDLAGDSRPGIHLGIVSGRRRQGKTFLLRALTSAAGGMYHQAQELGRGQALDRFAADVARARNLPVGSLRFTDWDIALRTALAYPARGSEVDTAQAGPNVLVLDELPYLLANSPEIPSVLQEIIDEAASRGLPPRCVIVCGSALSVMTDLLTGAKPLHGRAQLNMMIRPFGFRLAAEYWGITDPTVAFHVDAVLGGTAGYRSLIEQDPPATMRGFAPWLARSALNPAHALFNEKDYLLREDPRITDKQPYNSILSAVAGGAHARSQIGSVVARDSSGLQHPLEVLLSAGFLDRSQDALTQKRSTYTIADPIVRFGEVVVQPFNVLLEQRDVTTAWAAAQPDFRARVLGPHFERMCRDWVQSAVGQWPEPVGVVGATVVSDPAGRSQHQLDVVALRRGDRAGQQGARVVVLGEAKSGEQVRTLRDLERLRHIQGVLAGRGTDVASAVLAVFGRGGFDKALRAAEAADPMVRLIDLADLYR